MIALTETAPGSRPGAHALPERRLSGVGVVIHTVTGQSYAELVQGRGLTGSDARVRPMMLHETRRRLPGGHVHFCDDRPWSALMALRRGRGSSRRKPTMPVLQPRTWPRTCARCGRTDLLSAATWTHANGARLERQRRQSLRLRPDIHDDGFAHRRDMLGYVAHMRADSEARLASSPSQRVSRRTGARRGHARDRQGRGPTGSRPRRRHAARGDGSCRLTGRHPRPVPRPRPWLPTFAVAARDHALVMGNDWLNGSERFPLVPVGQTRPRR